MYSVPRSRLRSLIKEHATKRDIFRFFSEITAAHRRAALFEALFATLIVTVLVLAIARFFILPWYYVIAFPILYLFVCIVRIQRIDSLRRAEYLFPAFREQFLTIRDNFSKTHEMEIGLEHDVLAKSHEVEASGFFDPRRFSVKIIAILLLFFVTGFFSQFTYEDLTPFWHDFFGDDDDDDWFDPNFWFWQRAAITGMDEAGDIDSIDIIYGDEAELLEGLDTLPIELKAGREALGLSDREESRSTPDRYRSSSIDTSGAEYYEDSIPLSKHDVVRNYFRDQ